MRVLALSLWATLLSFTLWIFWGAPSPSTVFQILPDGLAIPVDFDVTTRATVEHPIKTLVRKAETDFEDLLAKQSTSFGMASSEYLRRYKRPPPSGFEIWYDFAVRHDSPIIDEFDIIDEALAPLWSLSGVEVKRRLEEVRGPSISHCRLPDRQEQAGCESLGGEVLQILREARLLAHLPETNILINEMDEPRVLITGDDGLLNTHDTKDLFDWIDLSHQHTWDRIIAECHGEISSSATRPAIAVPEPDAGGLQLSDNKSDALDLCHHPEYSNMHGFWRSPASFSAIRAKVPILSPAVLSTMGDIPFPAAAYLNPAFSYNASEDAPWENKTAGVYWAGSTTGSFQEAAGQAWKQDHRQRFVSLANNLEPRTHTYLSRSSGSKP